MNDAQREHWDILLEIDDRGTRLTREEIDFVGNLIDGNRKGTLTPGEMTRLRALHRKRVEHEAEDDDL